MRVQIYTLLRKYNSKFLPEKKVDVSLNIGLKAKYVKLHVEAQTSFFNLPSVHDEIVEIYKLTRKNSQF